MDRRLLLAGFGVLAIAGALLLGVLAPPASSGSSDARAATRPQLIVSRFSEDESTLWLVDPEDPGQRQTLFSIEHAPGWDVEGVVAPGGGRIALLVVPAGASDPGSDAHLLLSDGGTPRLLVAGLDLRGGLAWSTDSAQIFARRSTTDGDGVVRTSLLAIDAASGETDTLLQHHPVGQHHTVGAIYPIGRPLSGPIYAVTVGLGGSHLLTIADDGVSTRMLTSTVTRDWTLSPDGAQLAFTAQQGLELEVLVVSLQDAALAPAQVAPAPVATEQSATTQPAAGSAAPAWRPNGELSIGRFRGPLAVAASAGESAVPGFTLPAGWSPDGAYLALRSFDGIGPGAPGTESIVLQTSAGTRVGEAPRVVEGQDLRIIGWWYASP
ncbi:MAG: hypothetical protein DK306_001246 [Chloroflexi bacterium]|nr:MAG: hypothetical protein DK306_001246 [Chloroflexota bacterium]